MGWLGDLREMEILGLGFADMGLIGTVGAVEGGAMEMEGWRDGV